MKKSVLLFIAFLIALVIAVATDKDQTIEHKEIASLIEKE